LPFRHLTSRSGPHHGCKPSREYKLTQAAARFEDRAAACGELLQRVRSIVVDVGGTPVEQAELSDKTEKTREGIPLIAELSYDYDVPDKQKLENDLALLESFPIATVRGASEVFHRLQGEAGWLDATGTTKSDFAGGI